ncbi:MAG: hypothetical protein LKF53_02230 [Solobacterium sp.]|jgi:hypothetical protein|nr:hypothetical protein [Solobacterium sp.]MCH4226789.1 hypothetical protein [Solobacterium sp.]MCH4281882.1 hypothetical protein [Solobacterium sp.]
MGKAKILRENLSSAQMQSIADYVFNNKIAAIKLEALKASHPVKSYYWSDDSTNPASLFGFGTWTLLKDRVLIGAGNSYSAGSIGGATSHNHTVSFIFTDSYVNGTGLKYTIGESVAKSTHYSGNSSNMMPYKATYIWQRTA